MDGSEINDVANEANDETMRGKLVLPSFIRLRFRRLFIWAFVINLVK